MTLFDHKQPLLDLYQSLIGDTHKLFSDTDLAYFEDAESRFNQEQFNIVIAGRFNSGKSLLINRAFLKAEILPTLNQPTSCHPVYISYGETNQLIATYTKDRDELDEVIASDDEAIKTALTKYAAQNGDDHDRYSVFKLRWNDAELLQNGVVLIDTIGTEDTEEKYIQQTYREMERATAVIFTFNIKQAGTLADKEVIEKHLKDTGKKLFLVLTQADLLIPDEQQQVLQSFRDSFSPFFASHGVRAEHRIFVTSGKTGDGLSELRQALLTFIANDRFKELLLQHTHQLNTRLLSEQKQIETRLQDYQNKNDGDERSIREAREKMRAFEEKLVRDESAFDVLKDELINDAKYKLKNKIDELKRDAREDLENSNEDQLKSDAEKWLAKLVQINDDVGNRLQIDLREQVTQSLKGSMSSTSDLEEMARRIQSINEFSWLKIPETASGAGTLIGVLSVFSGIYLGVIAGIEATATAAQMGLLASGWAALVGSTATAPALAALSIAAPFVLGGGALAYLSYLAYKKLTNKTLEEYRQHIIDALNKTIIEIKNKMDINIKTHVNEQVDKYVCTVKKDIAKEIAALDKLIKEKDLNALQQQIDSEKTKQQTLQAYQQRLKSLQLV